MEFSQMSQFLAKASKKDRLRGKKHAEGLSVTKFSRWFRNMEGFQLDYQRGHELHFAARYPCFLHGVPSWDMMNLNMTELRTMATTIITNSICIPTSKCLSRCLYHNTAASPGPHAYDIWGMLLHPIMGIP